MTTDPSEQDELREKIIRDLKKGPRPNMGYPDNATELFDIPRLADYIQSLLAQTAAAARIEERDIAEHELREEHRKVQKEKALTPDGINGYWCAIRDLSLNNGDRARELRGETEKEAI